MNSVTYNGDGSRFVWPIPFVWASEADLGVSLIDRYGIERELSSGWQISHGQVVCVVPYESKIRIWSKSNVETASARLVASGSVAAGEAQQNSQGPSYSSSPVASAGDIETLAVADASDRILSQTRTEVDAIVNQARIDAAAMTAEASQSMSKAADSAVSDLQAELAKLREELIELEKRAWKATDKAFEYASQASIYSQRPGIAAVKDEGQIPFASCGLYIINPHLTHAPTPFMGLWPVKCPGEAIWDGVFFVGAPYPERPVTPTGGGHCSIFGPKGQGDSDDWVPCDHAHPQHPPVCGTCCAREERPQKAS